MLDKTKSYKLVGGKFVERTAEELARLEQLKAEQAKRAPAKKRITRTKSLFARVTVAHATKLIELDTVCCLLFVLLQLERYRVYRETFALPTHRLRSVKGLSPANLRRALHQLEKANLISVVREPPKPPLVTVRDPE